MKSAKMYLEKVTEILTKITNEETESINQAAKLIAERIEKDQLIHVFGSGGHSIMGAMEVFWRAGGFANVNPLFPAGLSLVDSHPNIERTAGIAGSIVRFYGVGADDVLLIINVNGINPLTIQSAMEAKDLGAHVIAITSPEFASNVPKNMAARHSSNKNLHELAEVVVNAHVPAGDSVVKIPGLEQTLGATSTYAVCYAANLIFMRVAEILIEKGVNPPIWTSANVAGGDEANKAYLEEYRPRVHHLYPMF